MEKEPESETSYGHNYAVALGLSKGLAVLGGKCHLVLPLHAVSMHQVELKITSGIPHQTAVPNTLSHKCIYSTSEVEMLGRSYCVC